MELLLFGDTVDANEAQRIGLVAQSISRRGIRQSAREIAERIARRRAASA